MTRRNDEDGKRVTLVKLTTAAIVHGQLRQAILMGRIQPGEWLRQEELATNLNVSRMPVREALQLLAEEGLLEFFPHRGARVMPLSIEELEEIYAARIGLEGLAARHAALGITSDDLARLRTALPRLASLSAAGEQDLYLREDQLFMECVYQAAGRPRLSRQIATLRERSERYLRLVFEAADRMHWLDYTYRLFQACAAHDGEEAETAVQDALRWTITQATPRVLSHLSTARDA